MNRLVISTVLMIPIGTEGLLRITCSRVLYTLHVVISQKRCKIETLLL